jgi:hypothetical protein
MTDRSYLRRVQRPSRYLGREINAVFKDPRAVSLRAVLAFPDLYEVGMSHLGLGILYDILNRREDIWAERVYAPAPDLEAELRGRGRPLASLESGTPLKDFHLLGVSLQYELSYTNILTILELGGIPLLVEARGPLDPVVVGGGPGAMNPEPVAPFFDALVLGDGKRWSWKWRTWCGTGEPPGATGRSSGRPWKGWRGSMCLPSLPCTSTPRAA